MGRESNGGHSTKAKGVDKRKNQYRTALQEAATPQDLIDVIKMLVGEAVQNKNMKAAQLLLAYYLGNPKETIETTHNITDFNIKDIVKFK